MSNCVELGTRPEFAGHSPGDWFAIRVRSKSERCVAMGLEGKGYPHFLPLCREERNWSGRVRKVERILIPGYVFARFDPQKRLPILTIPAVVQIVGTCTGPLPIAAEEIAAVRLIAESGTFAEPWPFVEVGQPVIVSGGPLRGLHGHLVEVKNRYRVVVSVSLLRRSVAAEVDRNYVRLDTSSPAGDPAGRTDDYPKARTAGA